MIIFFRCMLAGTCAYANDNNDGLTTAKRTSEDSSHRINQRRIATAAQCEAYQKQKAHPRARENVHKRTGHQGVFVLPWSMGFFSPWAAGFVALQTVGLLSNQSNQPTHLKKQKGRCIALPHLDIYWCKTGNM